jgi:hypothetical protein
LIPILEACKQYTTHLYNKEKKTTNFYHSKKTVYYKPNTKLMNKIVKFEKIEIYFKPLITVLVMIILALFVWLFFFCKFKDQSCKSWKKLSLWLNIGLLNSVLSRGKSYKNTNVCHNQNTNTSFNSIETRSSILADEKSNKKRVYDKKELRSTLTVNSINNDVEITQNLLKYSVFYGQSFSEQNGYDFTCDNNLSNISLRKWYNLLDWNLEFNSLSSVLSDLSQFK